MEVQDEPNPVQKGMPFATNLSESRNIFCKEANGFEEPMLTDLIPLQVNGCMAAKTGLAVVMIVFPSERYDSLFDDLEAQFLRQLGELVKSHCGRLINGEEGVVAVDGRLIGCSVHCRMLMLTSVCVVGLWRERFF